MLCAGRHFSIEISIKINSIPKNVLGIKEISRKIT